VRCCGKRRFRIAVAEAAITASDRYRAEDALEAIDRCGPTRTQTVRPVQQQAVAKQQEVRRKIEQLREIDAALETLIAACPGQGALQCCSIIDALNHRPTTPAQAATGQPNTMHRSKK